MWSMSPKVDFVHLDIAFSVGETFHHSSKSLLQSQLTADFPNLINMRGWFKKEPADGRIYPSMC